MLWCMDVMVLWFRFQVSTSSIQAIVWIGEINALFIMYIV